MLLVAVIILVWLFLIEAFAIVLLVNDRQHFKNEYDYWEVRARSLCRKADYRDGVIRKLEAELERTRKRYENMSVSAFAYDRCCKKLLSR